MAKLFFRAFQQAQEGVVWQYRNKHQLIALHFTPTPAHTELFAYDAAYSFLRVSGDKISKHDHPLLCGIPRLQDSFN